jgi:hypothetical protein
MFLQFSITRKKSGGQKRQWAESAIAITRSLVSYEYEVTGLKVISDVSSNTVAAPKWS